MQYNNRDIQLSTKALNTLEPYTQIYALYLLYELMVNT